MAINNEGSTKLIRFLFELKKRPQMFLNEKHLSRLGWVKMGFMFGYNNYAYDDNDIEKFSSECKNSIWHRFSCYICEKYNIHTPDYAAMIDYCQSEEKAFDLFFEELETFLRENNIEIPEVK